MWIVQHLIIAVPLGLVWIFLTGQVGIVSYAIGYLIGLAISVRLAQGRDTPLTIPNLFKQGLLLMAYGLVLYRDIFLSGVDVALRVLGVRPTRTGIVAVPVGTDPNESEEIREIIAGLSAHGITITPGELVVDYNDDHTVMYVHCLDVEKSAAKLDDDQDFRRKRFEGILGR